MDLLPKINNFKILFNLLQIYIWILNIYIENYNNLNSYNNEFIFKKLSKFLITKNKIQ